MQAFPKRFCKLKYCLSEWFYMLIYPIQPMVSGTEKKGCVCSFGSVSHDIMC